MGFGGVEVVGVERGWMVSLATAGSRTAALRCRQPKSLPPSFVIQRKLMQEVGSFGEVPVRDRERSRGVHGAAHL